MPAASGSDILLADNTYNIIKTATTRINNVATSDFIFTLPQLKNELTF